MGTVHVASPVEGFTGTVAGVAFAAGVAEFDDGNRSALRYFRQHGYVLGFDDPSTATGVRIEGQLPGWVRARVETLDLAPYDAGGPAGSVEVPGNTLVVYPSPSASKTAWVEFALAHDDGDPDAVAAMSKPDLIATFGPKES